MPIMDEQDESTIAGALVPILSKSLAGPAGKLPKTLWHYTNAKGLLGILASRSLRASHIATMNDAFEFRHSARLLRKAVDHRLGVGIDRYPISNDTDYVLNSLAGNPDLIKIGDVPNIFVSCFSSVVDQTTHWTEYGDRGRGYALGFSTGRLQFLAKQAGYLTLRCVYDPGEATELLKLIVLALESSYVAVRDRHIDRNRDDVVAEFCQSAFKHLALFGPVFKDTSFSNETEWRFCARLKDFSTDGLTFIDKGPEIRPYTSVPLQEPETELLPLTEIVIGPARHEIDKEISLIAVDALLRQHGYANVKVRHSESGYRG